ncbi:hypothetical protein [Luteolibacter luteus]|uniref:F-box/LRR-repeat protein 15-like leucin rich repeat domain-containing protein n=1 Tax=Luteolibacter luteus TaxID=2728835 RepID=A0A858RE75_9BACT|nr:hypothetical protein [Luteolibacter luteus]QJE94864.1 hypothetical protein HHL09_03410 [Luteolibacter luteus]
MMPAYPYGRRLIAACLLGLLSPAGCGYYPPSLNSKEDIDRVSRRHVDLQVRGLADEDIPALVARPDTRMLFFSDGYAVEEAKITDKGLLFLSRVPLPQLVNLDLGYCEGITNAGLRHVAKMDSVTRLSLMACPGISDAGLTELRGMKGLTELDLRGCSGITDRGLDHIARMPRLRWVQLGGCPNVSMEAVKRLQSKLPGARVEKDDREWGFHGAHEPTDR